MVEGIHCWTLFAAREYNIRRRSGTINVERDCYHDGPFFVWVILASSDYNGAVMLYTGDKNGPRIAWGWKEIVR